MGEAFFPRRRPIAERRVVVERRLHPIRSDGRRLIARHEEKVARHLIRSTRTRRISPYFSQGCELPTPSLFFLGRYPPTSPANTESMKKPGADREELADAHSANSICGSAERPVFHALPKHSLPFRADHLRFRLTSSRRTNIHARSLVS